MPSLDTSTTVIGTSDVDDPEVTVFTVLLAGAEVIGPLEMPKDDSDIEGVGVPSVVEIITAVMGLLELKPGNGASDEGDPGRGEPDEEGSEDGKPDGRGLDEGMPEDGESGEGTADEAPGDEEEEATGPSLVGPGMLLSGVESGEGGIEDGSPMAPDDEGLGTSEPRVEVFKVEGSPPELLAGLPASSWVSDGLGKYTV